MAGFSVPGSWATNKKQLVGDRNPGNADNEKTASFGKKHPFNNEANHQKLLDHCKERLFLGKELRDTLILRYRAIDQDLAGFVKYTDDDKVRMQNNRKGKPPAVVDVNLPLTHAKVDELLTFLLQLFWPQDGMHQAFAGKDLQSVANAFAMLLNQQGQQRQHFSKFAKFLYNAIKYNISGLGCEWVKEYGNKLQTDATGKVSVKGEQLIYEGNDFFDIDMYNFLWDPTCHPKDVAQFGEWCATVEMKTDFEIKKLAAAKLIYKAGVILDTSRPGAQMTFFQEHPIIRFEINNQGTTIDWVKFAQGAKYLTIGNGVELVRMFIVLQPDYFGLSESKNLEIWRIMIANGTYIVGTEMMNNAHANLPVCMTVPYDDDLFLQARSVAEQLLDLQRFASFLMNAHQQSSRKSLYGLTIFDPTIVDLNAQGTEVAGRVPVNPTGYGKKIEDAVKVLNDTPQTDKTVDQIQKLIDMMEILVPTNMTKQMTDLSRATQYQAEQTVQGTNRRSTKLARIIDDQAVKRLKFQMMYNVQQYQETMSVIDPQSGQTIEIDPKQLRDIDVMYSIGNGLQGMDKQSIINICKDLMNGILQSQQGQQEMDIIKFMDYILTLAGDKTDLNQFRRTAMTIDQMMAVLKGVGVAQDTIGKIQQAAVASMSGQPPQPQQQQAPAPGASPGLQAQGA